MKVIFERFPYRYVEKGTIRKWYARLSYSGKQEYTKRYSDMYLLGQSNATNHCYG